MTGDRMRTIYRSQSDGGAGADHAAEMLEAEKDVLAMMGKDPALLERALAILHRLGTEQTGWRAVFRRWYYSAEPLRNDAANLVREAGFGLAAMPPKTRLVGDRQ